MPSLAMVGRALSCFKGQVPSIAVYNSNTYDAAIYNAAPRRHLQRHHLKRRHIYSAAIYHRSRARGALVQYATSAVHICHLAMVPEDTKLSKRTPRHTPHCL